MIKFQEKLISYASPNLACIERWLSKDHILMRRNHTEKFSLKDLF